MARWGIKTFLQNAQEHIAPEVQQVFRETREEVKTIIENGIRDILTLTSPLFGPNEIAAGFSLFPEPVLNVNDTTSESASVFIPDDAYLFSLGLLDIGGRFGPQSELLALSRYWTGMAGGAPAEPLPEQQGGEFSPAGGSARCSDSSRPVTPSASWRQTALSMATSVCVDAA